MIDVVRGLKFWCNCAEMMNVNSNFFILPRTLFCRIFFHKYLYLACYNHVKRFRDWYLCISWLVFLEEGFEGVHKKELVNWYLKEMEGDIDTEAELMEKKEKVEKVIERLIHHVSEQLPL